MSTTDKHKELAHLTSEQRADFDAAMDAMKGVSTYLAGVAFTRHLTPGVNYKQSAKWHMAIDYARRSEAGKRHCAHLTVEKIRAAIEKMKGAQP